MLKYGGGVDRRTATYLLLLGRDLDADRIHILGPRDKDVVMCLDIVGCCVMELELESVEDGPDDKVQFCKCETVVGSQTSSVRHTATCREEHILHANAPARPLAERGHVLIQILPVAVIHPSLGNEFMGVWKDTLVVVLDKGRHPNNGLDIHGQRTPSVTPVLVLGKAAWKGGHVTPGGMTYPPHDSGSRATRCKRVLTPYDNLKTAVSQYFFCPFLATGERRTRMGHDNTGDPRG